MIEKDENQTFDLEKTKVEIEKLLSAYRTKKEEMVWADDDWEMGEIQEERIFMPIKFDALKHKYVNMNTNTSSPSVPLMV